VPCVEIDNPESKFDRRYFDAILDKSENSYELIYAKLIKIILHIFS
jgi:hypothetical protein